MAIRLSKSITEDKIDESVILKEKELRNETQNTCS